jgi:hypothetical protein
LRLEIFGSENVALIVAGDLPGAENELLRLLDDDRMGILAERLMHSLWPEVRLLCHD